MSFRHANIALAAIYTTSIMVSIFSPWIAIPLLILAMVMHSASKAGVVSGWKSSPTDTISILQSIAKSPQNTSYSKVSRSITPGFRHRNMVNSAMKRFRATGNAEFAFGKMASEKDPSLSILGITLYSGFSGCGSISRASKWMAGKCSTMMEHIAKMAHISESSDTMLASGINFFFPVFAGITINIIRFSSPAGYQSYSIALVAMSIYYIIAVNYSTASNSLRPREGIFIRTLQRSAFASFVMQVALRLSAFML
ncbi:MAG: hypothetical protein QXR73_00325 [Candidatus Micrarchaeaceae archaeon]